MICSSAVITVIFIFFFFFLFFFFLLSEWICVSVSLSFLLFLRWVFLYVNFVGSGLVTQSTRFRLWKCNRKRSFQIRWKSPKLTNFVFKGRDIGILCGRVYLQSARAGGLESIHGMSWTIHYQDPLSRHKSAWEQSLNRVQCIQNLINIIHLILNYNNTPNLIKTYIEIKFRIFFLY